MTQIKSSTNTTTWQRYVLRIHIVYCILIRGEFMGILLILKDFPLERCCGQKNLWNSQWKIWNFWALPKSDTLLGVKVLNWNKYIGKIKLTICWEILLLFVVSKIVLTSKFVKLYVADSQNHALGDVLLKTCSENFSKTYRKTAAMKSFSVKLEQLYYTK